jgi:hypothetical protein
MAPLTRIKPNSCRSSVPGLRLEFSPAYMTAPRRTSHEPLLITGSRLLALPAVPQSTTDRTFALLDHALRVAHQVAVGIRRSEICHQAIEQTCWRQALSRSVITTAIAARALAIEALVRIHNAQEEDIYEHAAKA